MPPGFRQGQISAIILRCLCQQISTFSGVHSSIATGSLRNIPSPEQGTSVRMTSKKDGKAEKSAGSLLVTTTSGCPHFARFSAKTCERFRMTSLATSRLPSGSTLRAWVDFPPGAAQRSNIIAGSLMYWRNACSTNIEEAS